MGRFNRKGTTKILWLDTITDTVGMLPSRTELDGATDYTGQIAAMEGFSTTSTDIDTPDMASTFVSRIPGDETPEDSSLTFYEDDTLDTIETDFAKGTTGYVVILSKGDTPGGKGMDVFPVRVSSNSKQYTADNEAAQIVVSFSITDRPVQNATVPTATP